MINKKRTYFVSISILNLLLAYATLAFTPFVRAAEDAEDEDTVSYEEIVQSLQSHKPSNQNRARSPKVNTDSFENVLLHGGIGYINTFSNLTFSDGSSTSISQRGIQAVLGIDLFSENWMAEGGARSFGITNYGNVDVGIKDFDLKLVFHTRIAPKLNLRLAGGLAARYLTVTRSADVLVPATPNGNGSGVTPPTHQHIVALDDYTTPSSIGSFGMDYFLNEMISFGGEVAFRSALINETIDQNSWDAGIRVDAHF